MKQDRTLLEQNLIKPTLQIKKKRNTVKDIKNYLSETYAIFDGSVQSWINNPSEELKEIDPRLLFLFAEQVYQKTGDLNINPEEYFTPAEIKSAKQYSGKLYIEEDIEFPLRFKPAIQHGRNAWVTKIDIHTLVKLLKSRKLNWNPDSQREATYKRVNGEIIEQATLYMPNVIEMKNLLKSGQLVSSQLTLNASVGTSDSDEEVIYDEGNYEVSILSGTKLDVIDGWHRIKASELTLSERPDIEFEFDLKILNLTVDRAAEYLAQISKGAPISEVKRRSMGKELDADFVIDELRKRSELGSRISKKEGLTTSRKELVTYITLANSIEKYFDLSDKKSKFETADYLIDYFDTLLSYFEDEFTNNYQETKESSLIAENNMFHGFVYLASRMKKEGVNAREIRKYINVNDFSRDNTQLWTELGVVDEKGRLTKNPKQGIEKYFANIEL